MAFLRLVVLSLLLPRTCTERHDHGSTTTHSHSRDNALLRLSVCLLRNSYGRPFDVELWEDLVRRKASSDIISNQFCDAPVASCVPPSTGKKKSAVERYLSNLIYDSIGLCGNRTSSSRKDKGDSDAGGSGTDTTQLVIIYVLLFLNVTGILSGIAYKYRSDCSMRSKNVEFRQHAVVDSGPADGTRPPEDDGQFQTLLQSYADAQ